jgi:hypothetical protein
MIVAVCEVVRRQNGSTSNATEKRTHRGALQSKQIERKFSCAMLRKKEAIALHRNIQIKQAVAAWQCIARKLEALQGSL